MDFSIYLLGLAVLQTLVLIILVFYILKFRLILEANAKLDQLQTQFDHNKQELLEQQKELFFTKFQDINALLLKNAEQHHTQIQSNQELFSSIIKAQADFQQAIAKQIQEAFLQSAQSQSQSWQQNTAQIHASLSQQSQQTQESFEKFGQNLQRQFDKISQQLEQKLEYINQQVETRLNKNFDNMQKTFTEIIKSITKISEAGEQIKSLSSEVVSLSNVLTDKKSRGIFGEVQLEHILKMVFGKHQELYQVQYHFKKQNVIADAALFFPDQKILAVDAKFPLENYNRMMNDKNFTSEFKQNIKKHIKDIKSKYIIEGITYDKAVLFLPAEAIFAEINAYHHDLLEEAWKSSVIIVSPSTFMALLTTLQALSRDTKAKENAEIIQQELSKLSDNFKRYESRWDKLYKDIQRVYKDSEDIHISNAKILKGFESIQQVDFKKLQN